MHANFLPVLLLLGSVLVGPAWGRARKSNKRGTDPHGLYPLFQLEPSGDRELTFSDGHLSTIEHVGGGQDTEGTLRAFRIRHLLRAEEAAALVAEAQAQPGGPQSSATEREASGSEQWRSSEQVWVPRGPNRRKISPLVRSLNRRTAELTRIPLPVVEDGSIQVARYTAEGHYYPHFDSSPLFQLGAKNLPPGAPPRGFGFPFAGRYLTLLIFLSDVDHGGNTTFPLAGPRPMLRGGGGAPSLRAVMGQFSNGNANALGVWQSHDGRCDGDGGGLAIAPKTGDAILFYNHHVGADGRLGELDALSFHGGCRVLSGEKWIANVWIEIEPPFCKECVEASAASSG